MFSWTRFSEEGEYLRQVWGRRVFVLHFNFNFYLARYQTARIHPYLYYSMESSSPKIFPYKINIEVNSKFTM